MTAINTIQRRLLWKELRQLWPLGACSVLIGIFFFVLYQFNSAELDRPIVLRMLIVGMPGLFAVGVGAMLVGQEKDQRTILWLSSLPVAKRDLVRIKLIASLFSLIVLWIISLLLASVFSGGEHWSAGDRLGESTLVDNVALSLHTFYLMLAGLALAWRFRSAFTALLCLVPAAFAPFVLAAALQQLIASTAARSDGALSSTFVVVAQLICIAVVTPWGWRNAMRALEASNDGRGRVSTVKRLGALTLPHSPASALLWQFAKQNTVALRAIVGLFAVAAFLAAVSKVDPYRHSSDQVFFGSGSAALAAFLVVLAISWLGALAFQSDMLQRRIRFLSDRGVSPVMTWLSRQAIPVCLVGIGLIVTLLLATRSLAASLGPNHGLTVELFQVILVATLFGALPIYTVSQWVGQLFTSPIIATITAPAISFGLATYLTFAASTIGTSFIILGVVAVLPLITTFVLTRRWMDCRFSLSYWLVHTATLVLFLLLPALPLIYAGATRPSISAATKQALAKELETSRNSWNVNPQVLSLQLPDLRNEEEELVPAVGAGMSSDEDAQALGATPAEMGASLEDTTEQTAALTTVASADDPKSAEMSESGVSMSSIGNESTKSLKLEDLTIAQRKAYVFEILARHANSSDGPLQSSLRVADYLRIELELARQRAKATGTSSGTTDESDSASNVAASEISYASLLNLATTIAERVRKTPQLSSQYVADSFEIMLLWELQEIQGKGLVDAATWNRTCALLTNRAAREKARRFAIAAEWMKFQTSNVKQGELVSAVTPWSSVKLSLVNMATLEGRVGVFAEKLWLLSDSTNTNTDAIRQELAALQKVPIAWYGLGSQGQFSRADSRETFMFETNETPRWAYGTQWNTGWEKQAQQLTLEPLTK